MDCRKPVVHAFVLVACGIASVAQAAMLSSSVAFESRKPGEIIVPVMVAGTGPHRFLLDTGSSHSSITLTLAGRFGLPAVARASFTTAAGTETYPIVRLANVALGSVSAGELHATVLPSAAVSALGAGVDGVIGQDFLSRFNYTLDYRHRVVIWGDEAEQAGAARLALEPSQGRFFVRLQQQDGCGCAVLFVPDSGADGVVLFETGRGTPLALARLSGSIRVTALIGGIDAQWVTLSRLNVGRATLRNQHAALVRVDDEGPDRGDGLLPLHLFTRVYFNNREGYLVID